MVDTNTKRIHLLATLKDSDFEDTPQSTTPKEKSVSVRAIIIDHEGNVCIQTFSNIGFSKLPGGRVEKDEECLEALKREILEETGVSVKFKKFSNTETPFFGKTREIRNSQGLDQTTYFAVAKKKKRQTSPSPTKSEIEKGHAIQWLPYSQAIKLLEAYEPDQLNRHFVRKRELIALKAARELIKREADLKAQKAQDKAKKKTEKAAKIRRRLDGICKP